MKKWIIISLFTIVVMNINGCTQENAQNQRLSLKIGINQTTKVQKEKQEEWFRSALSESKVIQKAKPTSTKLTSTIDYMKPTGGAYPELNWNNVWVDVSISKQRMDIKIGDKTQYEMIVSSGLDDIPDNSTPRGTYYVQAERGEAFYNQEEGEGAKYWVSWKNHGEFLFHSVPTDEQENIKINEAKKLGTKASHGCIRLSISDAKWIYDHIKFGTKVVIHD